ncbi:hypothetical protein CJ030_MR2G011686 [Morella rubra]|uniref:Uncharacterized protein n=1 Tax=Morella rubra TaxID=262757 RepID=A0A6A1WER7_9ROSI|nr:hypothetical protein CJ030_MR2G011686 [Morella rubra]
MRKDAGIICGCTGKKLTRCSPLEGWEERKQYEGDIGDQRGGLRVMQMWRIHDHREDIHGDLQRIPELKVVRRKI